MLFAHTADISTNYLAIRCLPKTLNPKPHYDPPQDWRGFLCVAGYAISAFVFAVRDNKCAAVVAD
jgi:hypothetical protein